jgi:hypothetical protein
VRGLKTLVVVMGVMLVAGVAILVVAIATRVSQTRPAVTPFAAPPLDLPAGARIETIGVGSDRLVVDIVLPDGNRQLLVIDLATGRRLGVIPLHTAP